MEDTENTRKRAPKANPQTRFDALAASQGLSTDPYKPGSLTLTRSGGTYTVGVVEGDSDGRPTGVGEVFSGNAAACDAFFTGIAFALDTFVPDAE